MYNTRLPGPPPPPKRTHPPPSSSHPYSGFRMSHVPRRLRPSRRLRLRPSRRLRPRRSSAVLGTHPHDFHSVAGSFIPCFGLSARASVTEEPILKRTRASTTTTATTSEVSFVSQRREERRRPALHPIHSTFARGRKSATNSFAKQRSTRGRSKRGETDEGNARARPVGRRG